jgi:ribosomal protein S3
MSSPEPSSLKRSLEDQEESTPAKRLAVDNPEEQGELFVIDTRPSNISSHSGSEDGELTDDDPNPSSYSAPTSDTKEIVPEMEIRMRSLVNTKEAGIIIGKQGSNIAQIHKETGMKVMVSHFVHSNEDRVMTCIGSLKGYSSCIHKLVTQLLEKQREHDHEAKELTIRLLIPSSRMGFVIGKGGAQIKKIREKSGAFITSQGDNLPNSTERVMSLVGDAGSLSVACYEIATMIGDHHEKKDGPPMVYFDPTVRTNVRSTRRDRADSPPSGSSGYSSRSRSPEPPSNNSQAQLQQLSALYAYYPQLQLLAQYPQLLAQYQQYFQLLNQAGSQQSSPVQPTIPLPGMTSQGIPGLSPNTPGLQNLQGLQALQSYPGLGQLQNAPSLQEQLNQWSQSKSSVVKENPDGTITKEISIPNNIVGALIGKKGASIKEIRSRTRCDVFEF